MFIRKCDKGIQIEAIMKEDIFNACNWQGLSSKMHKKTTEKWAEHYNRLSTKKHKQPIHIKKCQSHY